MRLRTPTLRWPAVAATVVASLLSVLVVLPAPAMAYRHVPISCSAPGWTACSGTYETRADEPKIGVIISNHANGGTAVRLINARNGTVFGTTAYIDPNNNRVHYLATNVIRGTRFYVQAIRRVNSGDSTIAGTLVLDL